MSTTLTNGLKLPDKGSVDWYADMQNNYAILDGAVGTVADHTAQIAGKAPVAHTHTKSDITDLFNSANTWTADNTFSGTNSFTAANINIKSSNFSLGDTVSSNQVKRFQWYDASNNRYACIAVNYATDKSVWIDFPLRTKNTEGTSFIDKTIRFQVKPDNTSAFLPVTNSVTDLGSSSYQWNNLYASKIKQFDSFSSYADVYQVLDSSNNRIVSFRITKGATKNTLGINVHDQNNSAPKGLVIENDLSNNITITGGGTNNYLGTSTNKWKTLWANGINSVPTNTVEWHNSHYRGINLISDGHFANIAALLTAIRNQDWSDIYIGDYVELTFTYEGASRTVKFYVGEIDKFYKVGDTSLETHHLVMVTGDLGINQVMNDTNTTAGGYVGSKAHTVTLPALYAILNPLFNNAILTHKEHLSNTVISAQSVSLSLDDGNGAVNYSCSNFPVYSSGDPNTQGCVTAGTWYDCNLVLMSEIEMFGSNRFASSGIDDIMCPEGQIAAFKYNRNLQTLNRTISTWLRNVNSASRFCYCGNRGISYRGVATNTYGRLRPRFLIG